MLYHVLFAFKLYFRALIFLDDWQSCYNNQTTCIVENTISQKVVKGAVAAQEALIHALPLVPAADHCCYSPHVDRLLLMLMITVMMTLMMTLTMMMMLLMMLMMMGGKVASGMKILNVRQIFSEDSSPGGWLMGKRSIRQSPWICC